MTEQPAVQNMSPPDLEQLGRKIRQAENRVSGPCDGPLKAQLSSLKVMEVHAIRNRAEVEAQRLRAEAENRVQDLEVIIRACKEVLK